MARPGENPDALVEAGVERYRAGAYRDAIAIFNSVVARHPDHIGSHLYLSLSDLRLGEDALAQRHLALLRDLPINARVRAQVDHLLEAMRSGPLSPPLRRFVVTALEEAMLPDRPTRVFTTGTARAGEVTNRNFPYFP